MKKTRREVGHDAIMVAGIRLVRRKGPRFTLAELGREVELSAARLVQRFGGRGGLVRALLQHWGAASLTSIGTMARSREPFAEYVRGLRAAAAGMTSGDAAGGLEWLLSLSRDRSLRRWYLDYLDRLRLAITGLLDAAVAAGELEEHDTSASAGRILMATFGAAAVACLSDRQDLGSLVAEAVVAEMAPHQTRVVA